MSPGTESLEARPALSEEGGERRPLVAFASSGLPSWVLALAALVLGGLVMLTMIGGDEKRFEAPAVSAISRRATPPLPPELAAGFNDLWLGNRTDTMGESFPRATGAEHLPAQPPAFSSPFPYRGSGAIGRRDASTGLPEQRSAAFGLPEQRIPGIAPPDRFTARSMAGGAGTANGSTIVFDIPDIEATAVTGNSSAVEAGPVRAHLLRNHSTMVAQGELVFATLETPANSDRPGPIRALVSRDVRSFDGSRVLIIRGSRLIGELSSEPQAGQRRLLATWNRLIRPDGVAIRLDSPSADAAGSIGMPGKVNSHFLARFANAALQTVMQVGVTLAGRHTNSVVIAGGGQLPGTLSQSIVPNADAPPTVSVAAGTPITVFVARDLDFSGVPFAR